MWQEKKGGGENERKDGYMYKLIENILHYTSPGSPISKNVHNRSRKVEKNHRI